MTHDEMQTTVFGPAYDVLMRTEPGEETEYKSAIRTAELSVHGEQYQILEQNMKRESKFAKLARNGHHVAWLINEDNIWYLMVDGRWTPKNAVSKDGALL